MNQAVSGCGKSRSPLLLWLLSAGLIWASISAASAADYVRIVNRWKPDYSLHTEYGDLDAGPAQPGWWSADWLIEPVKGENYVRLRNRYTGLYLHAEREWLEMGAIKPGWWSAMWTIERVPGSDYVRLRNRWLEQYVHIEHGELELGDVLPGWWSAMWQILPSRAR